jgi:hypothetical protein
VPAVAASAVSRPPGRLRRWFTGLRRPSARILVAAVVLGVLTVFCLFRPWEMLIGDPDLRGRPTVQVTGTIVDGCHGAGRKTAACPAMVRYVDDRGTPHTVRMLLGQVIDPPSVEVRYDARHPGTAAPDGGAQVDLWRRYVEVVLSLCVAVVPGAWLGVAVAVLLCNLRRRPDAEPVSPRP